MRKYRPGSVPINHPVHGRAFLRNHHTSIAPDKLAKVLPDNLTPSDWYRILNHKCFFWAYKERLNKMLGAYLDSAHDVLILDTRRLLARGLEGITVSHINSGTVSRGAGRRGNNTFHPIQDCLRAGWEKGIAELTVEGQVANIAEVTIRVERRNITETIWERGRE